MVSTFSYPLLFYNSVFLNLECRLKQIILHWLVAISYLLFYYPLPLAISSFVTLSKPLLSYLGAWTKDSLPQSVFRFISLPNLTLFNMSIKCSQLLTLTVTNYESSTICALSALANWSSIRNLWVMLLNRHCIMVSKFLVLILPWQLILKINGINLTGMP